MKLAIALALTAAFSASCANISKNSSSNATPRVQNLLSKLTASLGGAVSIYEKSRSAPGDLDKLMEKDFMETFDKNLKESFPEGTVPSTESLKSYLGDNKNFRDSMDDSRINSLFDFDKNENLIKLIFGEIEISRKDKEEEAAYERIDAAIGDFLGIGKEQVSQQRQNCLENFKSSGIDSENLQLNDFLRINQL